MFNIVRKIDRSCLVYISIAASQVASLIILLITSKYLSSEEFNKISIFETYLFFFQAIACLSIEKATTRYYIDDGDRVINFTIKIATLSFVVVLILTLLIQVFFKIDNIIILAVITSYAYTLHQIVLVRYQFGRNYVYYFFIYVAKNVIILFIFLLVFLYLSFSINSKDYFFSLTISICFIMLIVTCLVSYNEKGNYKKYKKYLLYSLPYIPTVIASWIINWSGRLFLENNVSEQELAVYAIAQKFSFFILLFSQGITTIISPKVYKFLKNRMYEECLSTLKRYFLYYLMICVTLVVLGKLFLGMLYIEQNYEMLPTLFGIFVIIFGINGLSGFTVNLFYSSLEKTNIQMHIYILISIFTALLYFIGVKFFNVHGIVYASLISSVLMLVIPLLILKFFYKYELFSAV